MFNYFILVFLNALFFSLKNNMLMLFIIIIQVTMSLVYLTYFSSWLTFFLFLMYLGGMMIVFMFIVAISPEKKIFLSLITTIMLILFPMNIMFNMLNNKNISDHFMSPFFNTPSMELLVMMFSILLLLMLMITKLFNMKEGPLRKIYV